MTKIDFNCDLACYEIDGRCVFKGDYEYKMIVIIENALTKGVDIYADIDRLRKRIKDWLYCEWLCHMIDFRKLDELENLIDPIINFIKE